MPWSPDGKWLAYTVEVRPVGDQHPQARLAVFGEIGIEPAPPALGRPAGGYRTLGDPGRHGGLGAPGRVDPAADRARLEPRRPGPGLRPGRGRGRTAKGRFEVVVLDGPDQVGGSSPAAPRRDPRRGVEASRRRRSPGAPTAATWPSPSSARRGLAIIRADNGRQINAINDAFLPVLGPRRQPARLLSSGGPATPSTASTPRSASPGILIEVGQAGQAPGLDARRPLDRRGPEVVPRGAEPPGDQADLVRVRVDTGQSVDDLRPS